MSKVIRPSREVEILVVQQTEESAEEAQQAQKAALAEKELDEQEQDAVATGTAQEDESSDQGDFAETI